MPARALYGPAFNLTSPAGTVIGAFLVDQDSGLDPNASPDVGIILQPPDFLTGAGSDVRFVHFPQIDGVSENEFTPLVLGTPVELIDDNGGSVQISIAGGDGNANSLIRLLPIDESEGVAIAEIVVDLTGGGRLDIISQGNAGDVISIGRVLIIGASGAASIVIDGPSEIDVWLIEQQAGAALTGISNRTAGGDLVAVDVIGLTNLDIQDGRLGRTDVPEWGPSLIGPFLGLAQGAGGGVGGAIGVNGFLDPGWGGGIYRPINNVDTGTLFLDDIGGPVDPYLNGVIVRTGNLTARAGE